MEQSHAPSNVFNKNIDFATFQQIEHPDYALNLYLYENQIVMVNDKIHGNKSRKIDDNSLENLALKHTGTDILDSTRNRTIRQLTTWISTIMKERKSASRKYEKNKPYPVFLTLTLPAAQIHPDKLIYRKCLWPLILQLKRNYNVRYYYWRAELQKNYNLHYHLIIDSFVDKEVIRELWNENLEKLNYITRFEKKHGHRNPPSTFIEVVNSTAKMASYVAKYAGKRSEGEWIDGRRWGMAKELKEIKGFSTYRDGYIADIIAKWKDKEWIKQWESAYCVVWTFTKECPEKEREMLLEMYTRSQRGELYDRLYNYFPPDPVTGDEPPGYQEVTEFEPWVQLSFWIAPGAAPANPHH